MAWTTWIAIYFIIWWVVLFAVLPWGVRSQHEAGDVPAGTDPGAPALPRLKAKVVWTTVASTLLFAGYYYGVTSGRITVDGLARLLGVPL